MPVKSRNARAKWLFIFIETILTNNGRIISTSLVIHCCQPRIVVSIELSTLLRVIAREYQMCLTKIFLLNLKCLSIILNFIADFLNSYISEFCVLKMATG